MQIAKYISSIANGGNVVKPTIIKSILNSDGSEVSRDEITQYTNEKLGYSDTDDGITISQESVMQKQEKIKTEMTLLMPGSCVLHHMRSQKLQLL